MLLVSCVTLVYVLYALLCHEYMGIGGGLARSDVSGVVNGT